MSFISAIVNSESKLVAWLEKMAATSLVGFALSYLHTAHPDWALPSQEYIVGAAVMIGSVHSLRDGWEALKALVAGYIEDKSAPVAK